MQVTNVQDRITHAVVSPGKTQAFGIAQTAEFFQVLSSSLYSDKPRAVARETLCNAWDAHIEAGVTDKAVKVSVTDNKLIIQDFGHGIHRDQIHPTYGTYGGTTKVANDAVTGGFGLGCKAPFAYTEHFEVTSCHKGVKTIYRMSLSSAVVGGLPTITEIVSIPTTETGLTVSMELKDRHDAHQFIELVRRIAALGEMKVELNSQLVEVAPFSKAVHGFLITNKEEFFGSSEDVIWVRYGNVVYPIERHDSYRIEFDSLTKQLEQFSHRPRGYGYQRQDWRIIIQATPNSISITPSRESLSMTDHTINTLKKLLKVSLFDGSEIHEVSKLFVEELIDKSFLMSTPKDLFVFGDKLPNINLLPGKTTNFLFDAASVAEHRIRGPYPSDLRVTDFIARLKALKKAGFGRKQIIESFLRYYKQSPDGDTFGHRSSLWPHKPSWFFKHYLWPIIKKMQEAKLDYKRLYICGKTYGKYGHVNGTGLTEALKWPRPTHEMTLPFLRDIIILGYSKFDLDRVGNFPVIKNWLGSAERGALYYRVPRTSKNVQKIRDTFKAIGMTVIDLTIAHPWEPKTITAPIPKAAPTVKRIPGIPKLSASKRLDGSFSIHKAYEKDTPRIEKPEFILVMSPRKDDTSCFHHFSADRAAAVIRLFGDQGGIVRNTDHAASYTKLGAKLIDDYVKEKVLEEFKTNKLLELAYTASVDHPDLRMNYGLESLTSTLITDTIIRKKFKIPDPPAQREQDFLRIWDGYSYYEYRDGPLKEIKKIIDGWKLNPELQKFADLLSKNKLMSIFSVSNLSQIFSGSPTPEKIEQQKQVRAILFSVLKG
jgi:hypothetical protein